MPNYEGTPQYQEQLQQAIANNEGCRVQGTVSVTEVAFCILVLMLGPWAY